MGQSIAVQKIAIMNRARFDVTQKESSIKSQKNRRRRCSPASVINSDSLSASRSHRFDLLLDMNPASEKLQLLNSWNFDDRSPGISLKTDDPLTIQRLPVQQTTDSVRGRVRYSRGTHAWAIRWEKNQRGTHAVVGVATKDLPLRVSGYRCLVGSDCNSWGWDIVKNKLWHNGRSCVGLVVPGGLNGCLQGKVDFVSGLQLLPDELTVILDMEAGTLGYAIDGQFLGVAFDGIQGKTVYPAVSAVWGRCEVTMRYLGGLEPGPSSLSDLCRFTIRQQIGKQRLHQLEQLPLPPLLINFLGPPTTKST